MKRAAQAIIASLLSLAVLGTSGCGTDTSPPTAPKDRTIMVFAAASLEPAFTQLGSWFSKSNPGTAVDFSFAGSSNLVTQLTQGDYADVFASADTANMDKAAKAGLLAGNPVNFASNTLTIAVAPGNPKHINTFRDLTKPGVSVVVCAPQVPCGSAAQKIEKATGVDITAVSEETSVTDVLSKVTTGQADAGLVYVSDTVRAGDKVTAVAFPEAADAVNVYPIAMLQKAGKPDLASRFIDLVTSPDGQKVLASAGFGPP